MLEFDGFQGRRRLAASLLAAALALAPALAVAQQAEPAIQAPAAIPDPKPIQPAQSQTAPLASLSLAAQFASDRRPIRSGLVWRILSETADG